MRRVGSYPLMILVTDTLRTQHQEMRALLSELNALAAAPEKNAPKIHALLLQFRDLLLKHLASEDDQLYPLMLEKAKAEGSTHHAMIIETFAMSMATISETVLNLLRRHSQQLEPASFTREWNSVSAALSSRFQAEETGLYPLLDRAMRPRRSTPVATPITRG